MGAVVLNKTSSVIDKLESVRLKLEDRFLSAGATMASALDGVEALLGSLDQLSHALEGDASTRANTALHGAASDLLALPSVQAERRIAFETLVQQSKKLNANLDQMRTMMRYLRAFAMNLKVTAAAAPEFNGFAQELMDRIAVGSEKLSSFSAKLAELDQQLDRALGFVCSLEGDCERLLPAVAEELQTSAGAIRRHNDEINAIAAEVSELARQIRQKVGAALMAMQIGDNTRQRIEHVQAGLALLDQAGFGSGEDEVRSEQLVRRLLLDQLADLAGVFSQEAQRVNDNLLGLKGGAHEVLRLKTMIEQGRSAAFLRDLESSVGNANTVVDQVRTVNTQASRAGREVVGAVETLLANVDAIQSVKTEIRYMAINTSIRCAHMGPAGRPVSVVGLELRAGADQLGAAADGTIGDLDGLAGEANRFVTNDVEGDVGGELNQALSSIRQAGDTAESSLDAVGRGSADVAQAMASLSAIENFHGDLCAALDEACEDLDDLTDRTIEAPQALSAELTALLNQIFKTYTMDREREIHRQCAPAEGEVAAEVAPANEDIEEDDALFANALF